MTFNYFNYYTEVEEHFQRVRGTSLFLLSSLDWALLESWKNAGVPLEAVLRGIDLAFQKWRSRKVKTITGEETRVFWVALNTKSKPLGDVRIRQALNYATDRGALARSRS